MKIEIKTVLELDRYEYDYCSYLTMHDEGMMQEKLEHARESRFWGLTFRLVDLGGTLIGWALLFHDDETCQPALYPSLYMYVDKQERRKGYGKQILQAVKEYIDSKPEILDVRYYIWSDASRGLYKDHFHFTKNRTWEQVA